MNWIGIFLTFQSYRQHWVFHQPVQQSVCVDCVLHSLGHCAFLNEFRDLWEHGAISVRKRAQAWLNFKPNVWKKLGTSLSEFILALKWGVLSIRRRMSSRRSSTTFTNSRWKRMQSSLMADRSSGILTRRCTNTEKQQPWVQVKQCRLFNLNNNCNTLIYILRSVFFIVNDFKLHYRTLISASTNSDGENNCFQV